MIVLLDIEWIEKNEINLTQLSALRVNNNWDVIGSLDLIAKPSMACLREQDHVAFGGYCTELFANSFSAEECMADFVEWLEPEDIIIVWAKSNIRVLTELLKEQSYKVTHRVISAAKSARKTAASNGNAFESPYTILSRYGIRPPLPEHRSSNDVEVLRLLLSKLEYSPAGIEKPRAQTEYLMQRERNQKVIDNSQYNYVFLKNSGVFHRRNCKVCLNAKSHTDILGSLNYEVAARDRRPCKLCNPVPFLMDAGVKSQLEKQAAEARAREHYSKELVDVKMLTGNTAKIQRKNILGWCHNRIHPGAVSKTILKDHDCLGKECRFFERNCQAPYWDAYEAQKRAAERKKEEIKKEKEKKVKEESALQDLTESWRTYLTEIDSDMQIVRVAADSPYAYRIFYVSDNRFADGNRYPEFLSELNNRYPKCRFILRHIRDIDGHFVTRNEYRMRRR